MRRCEKGDIIAQVCAWQLPQPESPVSTPASMPDSFGSSALCGLLRRRWPWLEMGSRVWRHRVPQALGGGSSKAARSPGRDTAFIPLQSSSQSCRRSSGCRDRGSLAPAAPSLPRVYLFPRGVYNGTLGASLVPCCLHTPLGGPSGALRAERRLLAPGRTALSLLRRPLLPRVNTVQMHVGTFELTVRLLAGSVSHP